MARLLKKIRTAIRVLRKPVRFKPQKRINFFPISTSPAIIFTTASQTLGVIDTVYQQFDRTHPITFLISFTWRRTPGVLGYLKRELNELHDRYPNLKVVFLSNSTEEYRMTKMFGIPTRLIPNNTFQREDQFDIIEGTPKTLDAIMNARLLRWKRIELARNVQSLGLITVVDDEAYFAQLKQMMPQAQWLNFASGSYDYLTRPEVGHLLNSARSGLILSSAEGNNRASIEYLLCGVPVVSTKSKGGREMFFDPDYCYIVDANPKAVADGVARAVANTVPPEVIRSKTLDKIVAYRRDLDALVQELSDGRARVDVENWTERYIDNMVFRSKAEHFMPFFESDFMNRAPLYRSDTTLKKEEPELWRAIVGAKAVETEGPSA